MQKTPGRMRVTQRAPQSCQRCASKKMRCSKQIPCTTCIKHGLANECAREVVVITRDTRNRRSAQVASPRRREERRAEQANASLDADNALREDETPENEGVLVQNLIGQDLAQPETTLDDRGMIFGPVDPTLGGDRSASRRGFADKTPLSARSGPSSESFEVSASPEGSARDDSGFPSVDRKPDGNHGIERTQNTGDIDNLTTLLKQTVLAPSAKISPSQFHFAPNDIPGPLSHHQAMEVVRMHRERVAWSHNVIYSPQFEKECEEYWISPHAFENMPWLALYDAVICIGLCHMSADEHLQIGITQGQEIITWYYEKIRISLEAADYTAVHSVYSIQAICLMTLCAYHHFSDTGRMTVLFGTAIRIAQAMGLNRLGPDSTKPTFDASALIDREVKKRIWLYLATQDWYATGTISAVTTPMIYPDQFNTPLPANCPETFEDTILWGKVNNLPLDFPTQTSYQIMSYKVARILHDFHSRTWSMEPLSREFLFEVLAADGKINTLMQELPEFLRPDAPLKPEWPPAVHAQRRMFKISVAHKLLVIHQSLFLQSFKDDLYTYTRQTCTKNAQTILREYSSGHDWEDETWAVPLHVTMAAAVFTCVLFDSPDPSFSADFLSTSPLQNRRDPISPKELLVKTRDKFSIRSSMRGGSMIIRCIEFTEQLLRLLEERGRSGPAERYGSVADMPSLIIERVGIAQDSSPSNSPDALAALRPERRLLRQDNSDMISGQWVPDLAKDIWGWHNGIHDTMDIGTITLDMGFFS